MKGLSKQTSPVNHLFKSIYCSECKQQKTCGRISKEYCCQCAYQNQRGKWTNYLTYERALAYEKQQWKEHQRDLQHLWTSKNAEDRENFADWKKFYRQKSWRIDLEEWLKSKLFLPVDIQCAKQWQKNKEHLPEKCGCWERKARESFLFFRECLEKDREKLKKCQCKGSEKVRVSSDYYAWCEKCEIGIPAASKKRVIKNRNDPKFWGLNIKERVLCGFCLGNLVEEMPKRKKYLFWEYGKRGYWKV